MSLLTVTTAATSRQLLSIAEMRAAAGVTGSGQDATLLALGLRVADAIAAECNIPVGSGAPPTLNRETLTETYRRISADELVLSRRHDVLITSILADTVELIAADYEVDPETGLLWRLCDDHQIRWCASKLTVVYAAGFEEVPGDLKMAAMDFFRLSWIEGQRDPALKSHEVDIPGVKKEVKTWWVGSVPGQSNEGAVPDVVSGQLKRFRNAGIA